MGLTSALTDPNIRKYLLRDEGEVIVDEVKHHWVVHVVSVLEATVGVALLIVFPFIDIDVAWLPFLLAFLIFGHAGWRSLTFHMDRFVITNMRVYRVNGVLSQKQATMPLIRILDITVAKPLHGRLLGFGHFVFESAAQEQGLKEIRYVGRPDERDLSIQRVVQRAGLRGPRTVN
jgi:uncharacterized membrane protein YdbT with pleckstrin-like domain